MSRAARVILSTTCALAVLVPSFGGVASAAPPPAPTTGTTPATTTLANTTITVRAGDSLVGLARRYQITLSALLRANSLQLNSIIHPGDALVIPAGATLPTTGGSSRALTAASSTPSASTSASTSASDYVVVAGDALSSIARRHGVSLGALMRANGISATSLIVPGQRLHVPPATRPIQSAAAAPTAVTGSSQPASTVSPPVVPVAAGTSMQTMLSYATAQVGLPYRFFSAGPDAFDCSGLVVAAFRQVGVTVPHQSRSLARMGSPVDWKADPIAAGDLVFTSSMNNPELITHVGIALDSNRWVNAVGPGRSVSISSLPSDSRIMAVQRIALP